MRKLVVMYSIDRKDPKNTWSGTSYELTSSLRKYVDVILVDLHQGFFLKLINKINIFLNKYELCNNFSLIFGSLHDKILEMKANYILKKYKDIPVLEIANDVNLYNNKFYIYQDLSIKVAMDIRNSNEYMEDIHGGGFREEYNLKEIQRQVNVQYKEYENAEKVFFMGKWVEQEMKRIYPKLEEKFCAVGGGVNSDFKLNFADDKLLRDNSIVFIGIDYKRKSCQLVIDAFELMNKKYKIDCKLYLIGPSKNDIKVENDNILVMGKLNRYEIEKYLQNAKAFCMPSKFEAYGLVFVEALLYGVPCIGINRYEMKYFIENEKNGLLINNYSKEELADKMYLILTNDKYMRYIFENREKYIKEYSWNNVAKKIIKEIFE